MPISESIGAFFHQKIAAEKKSNSKFHNSAVKKIWKFSVIRKSFDWTQVTENRNEKAQKASFQVLLFLVLFVTSLPLNESLTTKHLICLIKLVLFVECFEALNVAQKLSNGFEV